VLSTTKSEKHTPPEDWEQSGKPISNARREATNFYREKEQQDQQQEQQQCKMED